VSKARMRTIRESLSLIKETDEKTAITYNFIRRLCLSGKINSFTLGKKILLNYDELLDYLQITED
jgi:hypothetical protein